ncbi:hypothetical protein AC781_07660 [Akkermansia glycaniphila]|nr:hypothetical protein AC781_07660 [Akkermansia glycaniphila]
MVYSIIMFEYRHTCGLARYGKERYIAETRYMNDPVRRVHMPSACTACGAGDFPIHQYIRYASPDAGML